MRKALSTLVVLLVACLQVARADVRPVAAPADEYFGPYSQSVLEIRNRLDDYDKLANGQMLEPSVGGYLDHLQLAIRDWQHKYPRDPWLPRILGHLMREYWRSGQVSSEHGMAALAFMRAAYPDSPETSETVAMIYGSGERVASAPAASYDPQPAPEVQPAPEPVVDAPAQAAVAPPYETPASYQTLPSYATADDPASTAPANAVASSDVAPPADQDAAPSDAPDDGTPTPPPTR